MKKTPTPNKAAIKKHLEFLFGDCGREYSDGRIEIAYTPEGSGAVNKARYFDAHELDEATSFAYETNSVEGVNVYVGAALRDPDTAPFGRSTANDYYVSPAVWCDLDDAEAAKTAKNKYTKLPPSLIVVTGRHPNTRAQAWWKLMHVEGDSAALKGNLAHVCAALDGDPAVVDHGRVMRLGGTVAWPKKEGRTPELTEVITPTNGTKMVLSSQFKDFFEVTQAQKEKASPQNNNYKNPFTGNFEIEKLLEASKEDGKWHFSMRDAIASMVGKGWTDEQIVISTNPYRRDRSLTDDMITPLIYSARNKYDKPEPQENKFKAETIDPETGEVHEAPAMELIRASDMTYAPNDNDFVQNLLTAGGMSVVYGESNCGKTFFMTDLGFSVSENAEWRDRRVEGGAVVYVALEGLGGIKGRIEAYKRAHAAKLQNFHIMPSPLDFLDAEGDVTEFLTLLTQEAPRIGEIKLIVIDTLARAIGGGDENSGQDMGVLVRHADAIRAHTGAHICFVHHSGKDKAKGARGHSSLRAAVDTELEVSREEGDDFSNVKVVKQRDMEMSKDMQFTLTQVVLGQNKHGEDVTSCVVKPIEIELKEKTTRLNPIQTFIYNSLVRASTDYGAIRNINGMDIKCVSYDDMYTVMEQNGYKEIMATEDKTTAQQVKSATQAARVGLQKLNKISFNKHYLWLMNYEQNDESF